MELSKYITLERNYQVCYPVGRRYFDSYRHNARSHFVHGSYVIAFGEVKSERVKK